MARLEALRSKTDPDAEPDRIYGLDLGALPEAAMVPVERPTSRFFDRDDIEMLFRCLMQLARHLAKKYGFTIKQWPDS